MAHAVALIERAGPLDDRAEMAQALRSGASRNAQYMARAWLLAERLGLSDEWARWRHIAQLVVLGLAVLVAFSALGLARAVLGETRHINAVGAFATLLGFHFLTLVFWCFGLVWPGAFASRSLGRLTLHLTARLAASPLGRLALDEADEGTDRVGRTGNRRVRGPARYIHAHAIGGACQRVLQSSRLLPWAFGAVSHAIWGLAFALILAVLAFGFAFHAYGLSWETTILSTGFFQDFVRVTGYLPSLLGFPTPDSAAVHLAGAGSLADADAVSAQRAWAWWLLGCVLVYGLLPRLCLAILSYARWRAGTKSLQAIDTADPYVRGIFARLDALDAAVVTDPEAPVSSQVVSHAAHRGDAVPGTLALIGYELPPETPWPPGDLPQAMEEKRVLERRISGALAETERLHLDLLNVRPETLVVVVQASASPDRGTARFLGMMKSLVPVCRLLLVDAHGRPHFPSSSDQPEGVGQDTATAATAAIEGSGARRWAEWLRAERLSPIELLTSTEQILSHD